jgi:hypothetical protein
MRNMQTSSTRDVQTGGMRNMQTGSMRDVQTGSTDKRVHKTDGAQNASLM